MVNVKGSSEREHELLKERREPLVATLVAGLIAGDIARSSDQSYDAAPYILTVRLAFDWADMIIAESDRRQQDGE